MKLEGCLGLWRELIKGGRGEGTPEAQSSIVFQPGEGLESPAVINILAKSYISSGNGGADILKKGSQRGRSKTSIMRQQRGKSIKKGFLRMALTISRCW